jgi:hypothetical protein
MLIDLEDKAKMLRDELAELLPDYEESDKVDIRNFTKKLFDEKEFKVGDIIGVGCIVNSCLKCD